MKFLATVSSAGPDAVAGILIDRLFEAVHAMRPDLNLLLAFEALLLERNVTKAATRLHISQPALSAQLERLRRMFGDPLFIPARRGVTPTARALDMEAPLLRVLHELRQLMAPTPTFEPASAELTLQIAATDYGHLTVSVPLIRKLQERAPGIRAVMKPIDLASLQDRLADGSVDFALWMGGLEYQNVDSCALFDEKYVCAMRVNHPKAKKALTLDAFCSLKHVIVSASGPTFHGTTDMALAEVGRTRRVALSASHFLLIPEILEQSNLVAVLPERLVRRSAATLRTRPLPINVPGFSVVLYWHRRIARHIGYQWLRALIVE